MRVMRWVMIIFFAVIVANVALVPHIFKGYSIGSFEIAEDYEQSILYYLKDGGVIRFNGITAKTKFNAPGGLGPERYDKYKVAAEYLTKKYPELVTRRDRKDGTPEVRLNKMPRMEE